MILDTCDAKDKIYTHINNPYEDQHIKVHFVGDVICTKYYELKPHTNPGYEICLIAYGKGFFKIHKRTYSVESDQVFITKPPQIHALWPSKDDPYRILYICFSIKETSIAEPLWEDIHQKLESVDHPVVYDKYKLQDIHCRLMGEILSPKPYYNEIVKSLINQFILLTVRNFEFKYEDIACEEKIKNIISSRVINYIDDNIEQAMDLQKISSYLGYSISHVCRSFKQQTGFTIMEYYNFSRLEKAKQSLIKNDKSISDISEEFGFSSLHHFSNAFKTLYCTSPSEYRKVHRDDNLM